MAVVQPSLFARRHLAAPERPRRGRPPKPGAHLPHRRRPAVDPRRPHHVTIRMRRGVWNLRSQRCFRPIAEALRAVRAREGFRVVHFSVQGNHLHLVTEADDRRAMSNGMRALLIRFAKRLNRVMGSKGRLYADRFHERILRTPTEMRNVLRYVLGNHARHAAQVGKQFVGLDPFSSAVVRDAVAAPASWLLSGGWLRAPPTKSGTP
ncbi:MAG: transposase [Deltaproteobacteria bacterium]|nr:transposase [Deltaproteobacteria bacterium]